MNYKFINNLEELQKFIDLLPDLTDDETYFVVLMARKKNVKNIKVNFNDFAVKTLTAKKQFLIEKIANLQVEVDSYKYDEIPVPQEAFALYITPNPRSYKKAMKKTAKDYLDILLSDKNETKNPQTVLSSNLQTSFSRKYWLHFDFDINVDNGVVSTLKQVLEVINIEALTAIRTKGGFHLLVQPNLIDPKFVKNWYLSLTNIEGHDKSGDTDGLMPIPGTSQSIFTPYVINLYEI